MLFFKSNAVLTNFRYERLLRRLQAIHSGVSAFSAEYVFFVDSNGDVDCDRLATILPQAQLTDLPTLKPAQSFFIVPRFGTISPWSSKATDILHRCGLNAVERAERGMHFQLQGDGLADLSASKQQQLINLLFDPMTESLLDNVDQLDNIFEHLSPKPLTRIPIKEQGIAALQQANQTLGLSLSDDDMQYLVKASKQLKHDLSDTELMMFSQVNSEHCRHKIFNAVWTIDGEQQPYSLFEMIRHTYQTSPFQALVAYADNAAVLKNNDADLFFVNEQHQYATHREPAHFVLKVETHNHPTAISPFPGAATGSGGEIRDEAATGRGAKPVAGLCGFSTSHLHIPNLPQPWEFDIGKPAQMASALEIMLQGPIGAASFNNEFGRPNICGYFRTLELKIATDFGDVIRGYHKPIMIAGGVGRIRESCVDKQSIPMGAKLIVLGGPAMAIGLGGGSASSRASHTDNEDLDFASVQRSNPEMERRAQQVINACWARGEKNPILSIHDVGAGGLSNALPELVEASERGATFDLRNIPNAAQGMTPMEIWCNEAQERFVLAIEAEQLPSFSAIAKRERCPFAVVGDATAHKQLIVNDPTFDNKPVDLPLSLLFDDMPRMQCQVKRGGVLQDAFTTKGVNLSEAIARVLQFPSVSDKRFLITIGDRSVTGAVTRDQMVGPWQVPVADCAVTCSDFSGYQGEAMAMGERAPIAIVHPVASARMAIGEAITNIAAALIDDMSQIAMSANWMAAANYRDDAAGLYDAVRTVGMELCPALGISIPVGKDSLSMRALWEAAGKQQSVVSPVSLVVTAAAPVYDVRATLTPQLRSDQGDTTLLLIDLGKGACSMAGSVLAQVYQQLGQRPPDVDSPELLKQFFVAIQRLNCDNYVLAYHDRSDGGLLTTLCEMMFAGHTGVSVTLDGLGSDPIAILFNEELGAVLQVRNEHLDDVNAILKNHQLDAITHVIGALNTDDTLSLSFDSVNIYQQSRVELRRLWSAVSYHMQALRDHPECAKQEYDQLLQPDDPGLFTKLSFDINENIAAPYLNLGSKPKVAILREQGVNGHLEMAGAFARAGFACSDVHMQDLIEGDVNLRDYVGMAACGGFSYGDVLGAGRGWAQSILMQPILHDQFQAFFERKDTFSLGVCNGCQMMANIKSLIPGAEHWPQFVRNQSEQFEARLLMVKVAESPSIFFNGMQGSLMPVVVAHGEGRTAFGAGAESQVLQQKLVTMQYIDTRNTQPTECYPSNPNGSLSGITGLTTPDGRIMVLMPHPERLFRAVQFSWHPDDWQEDSPWTRMFYNARDWVG